jgi:hypothetical protein
MRRKRGLIRRRGKMRMKWQNSYVEREEDTKLIEDSMNGIQTMIKGSTPRKELSLI